jgi:CHASE2 domain-containing sensor protein
MRWRARVLLRDWAVFLAIMAAGLLTGILTWAASQPAPACHQDCSVTSYYKNAQVQQQAGP